MHINILRGGRISKMMQVLLKMSDNKSHKGGESEARFKSHHLKNLHKMFRGGDY